MNKSPIFLSVLLVGMIRLPFGCDNTDKQHAHHPKPAAVGTNAPAASVSAAQVTTGDNFRLRPVLSLPQTGPHIQITSPLRLEKVESSDVGIFVKVTDLPAERASHVHILLDNLPPEELPDPQLPAIFHKVSPGLHLVRAIVCQENHVSFKNLDAFAEVAFTVAGPNGESVFDPALPTFTFNLPTTSARYSSTQKLPVDFLIQGSGDVLASEWKVRVSVDGEEKLMLDANAYTSPPSLPPLSVGNHSVRMELLDASGRRMKANFAWTERTVVVKDATQPNKRPGR